MSILENKLVAIWDEIQNLVQHYPAFITKSQISSLEEDIPIFAFHSIEPDAFEKQLSYLDENGYMTLSTQEYLWCVRGEKKYSPRRVVLTIDDGRQSVWKYAYPLLKKYGMKAVLFVLPGQTHARGCSEKSADLFGSIERRDAQEPLLSWHQLERIHSSGVLDIQSHTLNHHLTYVSSRIKGVYTPLTPGPYYSLPVPKEFEGTIDLYSWDVLYGLPIYEFKPLMLGQPRYFDDPSFRQACQGHYQKHLQGTKDSVIKKEMAIFMREYRKKDGFRGRMATPQEMHDEIIRNLKDSKTLIELHLPGHRVQAVCWPFGAFSQQAINLAMAVGYEACFCGTLRQRNSNRIGDTPFFTVRYKNDYIFRLPGEGRLPLSHIMGGKLIRRARGDTGY